MRPTVQQPVPAPLWPRCREGWGPGRDAAAPRALLGAESPSGGQPVSGKTQRAAVTHTLWSCQGCGRQGGQGARQGHRRHGRDPPGWALLTKEAAMASHSALCSPPSCHLSNVPPATLSGPTPRKLPPAGRHGRPDGRGREGLTPAPPACTAKRTEDSPRARRGLTVGSGRPGGGDVRAQQRKGDVLGRGRQLPRSPS